MAQEEPPEVNANRVRPKCCVDPLNPPDKSGLGKNSDKDLLCRTDTFMSATQYVEYADRGFWAYDVALGVFLKHLIDAAETSDQAKTAWLSAAVSSWRVGAWNGDYGLTLMPAGRPPRGAISSPLRNTHRRDLRKENRYPPKKSSAGACLTTCASFLVAQRKYSQHQLSNWVV